MHVQKRVELYVRRAWDPYFHSATLPEHCLARADQWRGRWDISYHHHLDDDCLRDRPLVVGKSLRAQTLWPQLTPHRDTNNAATVQSSLHCAHRIRVVSYDFSVFREHSPPDWRARKNLKKRERSVEIIPPWAAPTQLRNFLPRLHNYDASI